VVQQAIEQRGGDHGIAEDLAPFGKAAVGGEDHGAAFVAGVDQLKEQVPAAGDDGQVADLVDDEQLWPAEEADALAERSLALGLGERTSNRISALILATRHASLPTTEDEAILLDIDLSILAAGDARYDRYAAQIRAEHEFVKDAEFAAGRAKFLRSMLKRPRLFHSSLLGSTLEPRARANVAAEIARLEEQQLKV
jgi:predicted metal-dependent HD superfamily phosphohydrolase